MPDPSEAANTFEAVGGGRSTKPGDFPEAVGRRYFIDRRGGAGLGLYADAQIKDPAFRDQGHKLATARNDPNAIRDMVAIARHRGWDRVTVSGSKPFRREAWIAARSVGLEVLGYRPTERDLQALDRQRQSQRPAAGPSAADRSRMRDDSREVLRLVETVVRSRVSDPERRASIVERAESRLADWLDRGARFQGVSASLDGGRQDRHRSR